MAGRVLAGQLALIDGWWMSVVSGLLNEGGVLKKDGTTDVALRIGIHPVPPEHGREAPLHENHGAVHNDCHIPLPSRQSS